MAIAAVQLKSRRGGAAMQVTEVVERDHRPWWYRLRSAFMLALALIALGAVTAAAIGLAGSAVVSLFDQALG